MNKKSRGIIGATAEKVSDLEKGRLTSGLFLKDGNWRKINGGNATVSETFINGDWDNILIFNGETYDGNTPVSGIEY